MKKHPFSLLYLSVACAFALTASPASAQERTAGGTLGAETSWTALQNRIDKTNDDVRLVRIDVDTSKDCGKKNQIWNPNKGCVNSNVDLSDLDKIKYCNTLQKFYSPTTPGADAKTGCVLTASAEKGIWVTKTLSSSTGISECAKKPTEFSKCTLKGDTCYVDSTYGCTVGGGGTGGGGGNNGYNSTCTQRTFYRCQF